jgi:hypothetical protein
MANVKITDLTAYTNPATTDVVPIVDVGNDITKKVSVGEVVGKITGDVDVATNGTSSIAAGVIVNADVDPAAAIEVSKLADGAARQLLQTDAAGTGVEWTDNIDLPGTLDVTGATTLDSTLDVTGATTLDAAVTIGSLDAVATTKAQHEESEIRRNAAFSVGIAGAIPFGVGPVIPPGMAFFGIGPDAYNSVHLVSGSFC